MKKLIFSTLIAALMSGFVTSCADSEYKSDSYLYDDDLTLKNPGDSLYSIVGLMTKVQQLGERYVLFGEVRGDLMTVSPTADLELQELSRFEPQTNDTYLRRTDFYGVINHCNWIISKMDPEVTVAGQRVLADEYAAAVLYRAWTYLQLGLAYGQVEWITKPIMSLEDSEREYEKISLDELVRRLIVDIEPVVGEKRPNIADIDGTPAYKFFLIPRLLLADLYLYDGQYASAASLYYNVIKDESVTMAPNAIHFSYASTTRMSMQTTGFTSNYASEVLTSIPYSTSANAYHTNLLNLTINDDPALRPSAQWVADMAAKTYYFGSQSYVANSYLAVENGGDLRAAVLYGDETWHNGGSIGFWKTTTGTEREMMISKFYNNGHSFSDATTDNTALGLPMGLTQLALARNSHVYLRFAEAVNRLGKPTLAYAVVRYGLNKKNVEDEEKAVVNPAELESGEEWLNWSDTMFDNNFGSAIRGRGYGLTYPESVAEDLPEDLDENELMLYIEDILVDEMAAETAFEGNRFFDLVRVAHHRGDDASFFASRVSRRFDDPAAAYAKLLDRNNWFIR